MWVVHSCVVSSTADVQVRGMSWWSVWCVYVFFSGGVGGEEVSG